MALVGPLQRPNYPATVSKTATTLMPNNHLKPATAPMPNNHTKPATVLKFYHLVVICHHEVHRR
jgi:hypothetical protein